MEKVEKYSPMWMTNFQILKSEQIVTKTNNFIILLLALDIICFFFFFSFYGCACGIWNFLGQELNQSCSCRLCHSHSNTGSEPRL